MDVQGGRALVHRGHPVCFLRQQQSVMVRMTLRSEECKGEPASPATVRWSMLLSSVAMEGGEEEDGGAVITIPGCLHPDVFPLINSFCDLYEVQPWSVGTALVTRALFDTGIPVAYQEWLARLFLADSTSGTRVDRTLYQVLHAANFLQIQPLVDLCCAKLASVMMCLSAPDIHTLLA